MLGKISFLGNQKKINTDDPSVQHDTTPSQSNIAQTG